MVKSNSRFRDLTGKTFGLLTAVELAGKGPAGNARWLCRCRCGNEIIAYQCNLLRGWPVKCGRDCARMIRSVPHASMVEFGVHAHMLDRCRNKNSTSYRRYGGRGIAVCKRWGGKGGFENFLADMGLRPSADHQLDRIDNDGHYEPGNCRWATRSVQQRNRSDNILLTIDGKTMTLADWSEYSPVGYKGVQQRLNRGLSPKEAVFLPRHGGRRPWWRKTVTLADLPPLETGPVPPSCGTDR